MKKYTQKAQVPGCSHTECCKGKLYSVFWSNKQPTQHIIPRGVFCSPTHPRLLQAKFSFTLENISCKINKQKVAIKDVVKHLSLKHLKQKWLEFRPVCQVFYSMPASHLKLQVGKQRQVLCWYTFYAVFRTCFKWQPAKLGYFYRRVW